MYSSIEHHWIGKKTSSRQLGSTEVNRVLSLKITRQLAEMPGKKNAD